MRFKKLTDKELLKELRVEAFSLGLIAIAVAIAGLLWKGMEEIFYGFMLWLIGVLLIINSSKKYIQEHPKVGIALMLVLLGMVVIGLIIFFIVT